MTSTNSASFFARGYVQSIPLCLQLTYIMSYP